MRFGIYWQHANYQSEEVQQNIQGQEIDILICTDVLSEGQNLQDAGVLVNYDLHWNPVRMIQRAGRIDRGLKAADCVVNYFISFQKDKQNLLSF